jgi:hypothetical protein
LFNGESSVTILTASYPELSAAVGAAQVVDALILWRGRGQVTSLMVCFCAFEYLWALVSVMELLDHSTRTPAWLPLSFVGWIAVGIVVGVAIRRHSQEPVPPSAIPLWSVAVGGAFGASFCVASLGLTLRAAGVI